MKRSGATRGTFQKEFSSAEVDTEVDRVLFGISVIFFQSDNHISDYSRGSHYVTVIFTICTLIDIYIFQIILSTHLEM